MVEMSLKELFEIGQSFESSVGEGTKGERARIFKNNSRLNLTDEMISFIESIDYEVNFLVSGEIWCPDFQLNATVLKRFLDLNTNFNMSVITMNNPSSLRVKLDAGLNDSTGNTIVKSKTYSNLKYNANNQDVYDVAQALMGLQDYTVLEVLKQDSTTLEG